MEEKFKLVTFENKIPLSFEVIRFDYIYRQMHSQTELILVLKGKCDVFIGEKEYQAKEDDIFIVNPFTFHHFISEKGAILLSCKIDQMGFGMEKEEADNLSFNLNSMENQSNKRFDDIKFLVYSLAKFNTKENTNMLFTNKAIAFSLFAQLLNDFRVSDTRNSEVIKNYSISTKINDYIIANYKDNLTLEILSEKFNYTVSYLSRFFKQAFGKNFHEYYDSLRVNYSLFDLVSSKKSIEEIALMHGFINARSYVRAFKSIFNEYPSEYRKHSKSFLKEGKENNEDLITTSLDIILKKYDLMHKKRKEREESSRDIDVKTEVNFDAQDLNKNQKAYQNLLSLGSTKLIMIDEVKKSLKTIQNEIGFKYITLADLTDSQLGLFNNTKTCFTENFIILDRIINFLNSINLLPLFKFELNLQDDENGFLDFVLKLITHYISLYGLEYVSNFRFSFKIHENLKSLNQREINHYFKMYANFFKLIKSISKNIKVTTINFSKKDILNSAYVPKFFDFIKKENINIDIFLIDYQNQEYSTEVSQTKNELYDFINYLIEHEMYFKKKVYIENINFTNSVNLLNDTLYSSNYLVRNYLKSFNLIAGFSKYCFTDLDDFMGLKEESTYHGGNGYFTSNAIKKSSFNAMLFISKLGDYILAQDSFYLVTRSANKIIILLNNYSHYSNFYAENKYFELTKTNRYECFSKSTNVNFLLRINNVFFDKCRITETSINQNSGSSYDIYLTLGAPKLLKFNEEESLKKLSEPKFNIKEISIKENTLNIETKVHPLETKLIEIELFKDYL